MKKNQVEQSVKRAFVNAAPYQLDKVTEKCKEQKGKVIPLENKQVKKSINKTFARIAAAAAALVLMIMGSYAYGERYGVASTVALDVNPSIEIGVNKGEKVVYVTPKNEDGTVDFKQDFFEKPAYLTVSGQLEGEAMALAFGKIYTFGPTFRAEKSYTQRHAAEFWMIEPEIAFADLEDDMELAEAMIKYVISYVMESCKSELEFLNKFVDKGLLERLHSVVSSDFARVTYTDAVKELEKYNDEFDYKVYWGCDLQTEHERCLTERIFKRPVFVTDYPKEIKAFYMRLNDDGKTVAAVDLLVMGIGEIIGGSQREERLDVLTERIEELGLDPKDYWWYLDLRRYGGVKHSGFGLGFERLVMYLTGISNIRDVLPFPRTTGSADF